MEIIKKNIYIILIVLAVVILLILRNTGSNHFRYDAKRWAEPSFSGANLITSDKVSLLGGDALLIYFDEVQKSEVTFKGRQLSVSSDSVLSDKYRKIISSNRGPVVLYSSDYSLTSRIWMILSQAGFRNILIFSPELDNEVIKKEIRPDSSTRPD